LHTTRQSLNVLSSHCHLFTTNVLVHILNAKQTVATAATVNDSPIINGTVDAGCSKFGTTPGGGVSAGICASCWGVSALSAVISAELRTIFAFRCTTAAPPNKRISNEG
jgi:hypothetical protein